MEPSTDPPKPGAARGGTAPCGQHFPALWISEASGAAKLGFFLEEEGLSLHTSCEFPTLSHGQLFSRVGVTSTSPFSPLPCFPLPW